MALCLSHYFQTLPKIHIDISFVFAGGLPPVLADNFTFINSVGDWEILILPDILNLFHARSGIDSIAPYISKFLDLAIMATTDWNVCRCGFEIDRHSWLGIAYIHWSDGCRLTWYGLHSIPAIHRRLQTVTDRFSSPACNDIIKFVKCIDFFNQFGGVYCSLIPCYKICTATRGVSYWRALENPILIWQQQMENILTIGFRFFFFCKEFLFVLILLPWAFYSDS